eukprot:GSChrysophyteH1.ASY1.ANO1.2297.1 assembled CDS
MMGKEIGKRTLILVDDMIVVQTHSLFLEDLKSRGHLLSYHSALDSKLQLHKFGDYLYDNIVYFAPEAEHFAKISFSDFTEFIDQGGNLLVGASGKASAGLRNFAESCGVEFDPEGSAVIDHFNVAPELDKTLQHTALLSSTTVLNTAILPTFGSLSGDKKKVAYSGIGHAVEDTNILAAKTLQGNPSTYSADPTTPIRDFPENAGADVLLVSAIQGRNNVRTVFSGSIDMFSNEYFALSDASNRAFCADISAWAFGENGVLRFRDVTHYKKDGTPPDITRNSLVYRIKDEITYSLVVEELRGGEWAPFHTDDMQVEFVMLDAHVLKTMTADRKTGRFSVTFTAPDNYGIFKFRVLYRRQGLSVLHSEEAVSLRPYKHDEYDRFLFTAYPYYTSAFSAVAGFAVFSIFFLFSSDKK